MSHYARPRLADPSMIQKIRKACIEDNVHLSGKAHQFLAKRGIYRSTVLNALVWHIDEGFNIYVKTYRAMGGQGYQGSLLIDPIDTETLYFEVKLQKVAPHAIWLQLHEHDTGYPPLPR